MLAYIPPVSHDFQAWGLFFYVDSGRLGAAKTYGLITLPLCQPIFLSCRPALRNRSSLCLPFALIYTMKTNAVFQCDHLSTRNWNIFSRFVFLPGPYFYHPVDEISVGKCIFFKLITLINYVLLPPLNLWTTCFTKFRGVFSIFKINDNSFKIRTNMITNVQKENKNMLV